MTDKNKLGYSHYAGDELSFEHIANLRIKYLNKHGDHSVEDLPYDLKRYLCRFAHIYSYELRKNHPEYQYIFCRCNREYRESSICSSIDRATNLRNGFACHLWRPKTNAWNQCSKCGFTYETIDRYRQHMDDISVVRCEMCGHREEYT